ncbi:glycosyltransferase family 2 protein [Sneathiella limimaris]|uniref:glycosyltransferase family 2 protein n=1 Tax=Sneathiella limimaris TaxID=1964213 RepID=UPI0019D31A97|nr:glycosyltransferase family 2 protein [Sneathiella limimaris]
MPGNIQENGDLIELSIIIVSYNTCTMTLKCIKTVFQQTHDTKYEVIVYDNDSSDNSADQIAKVYGDKVKLIQGKKNIGFAAANNAAIKEANGNLILLLNPDTEVLDSAIDKLLSFRNQHPKALIWGGKTVFENKDLNPSSCWSKQSLWSLISQAFGLSSLFRKSTLFNSEGIGGWDRDGVRQVDIVSGCFFLIEKDFWDKLNGFHPDFFMYGEEADFCLRAAKAGAKPMVTSDAVIIHHGGASETVPADKLVKLIKAKMCLIDKHFSSLSKPVGKTLLAMWPFSRMLAHKVLSLLRSPKHNEKKSVWEKVWQRRQEWMI